MINPLFDRDTIVKVYFFINILIYELFVKEVGENESVENIH